MRKLIICADDLGISEGVNDGILLAYKNGVVTDTSILVNGPATKDAVNIVKKNKIPVGLHINLTSYSPVSPLSKVKTLCDGKNFHRPDLSRWDFSIFDKADGREVEREIIAQFKLFRKFFGKLPTHLDSHKCEHGDPKVLSAVKKLAVKYKIPVRIPYWNFRPNYAAEVELRRAGVIMSDNLAPIDFYEGLNIDINTIDVFIKKFPEGTTEIVTMPAFVDLELLKVTGYQWQRARTLALMMKPEFKEKLRKMKVKLIDFTELKREKNRKR